MMNSTNLPGRGMNVWQSKPRRVKAYQWLGYSYTDADTFCAENDLPAFNIGSINGVDGLIVRTSVTLRDVVAKIGDWVIRHDCGNIDVVTKADFMKYYERAAS